jgi:hypothetical protein
LTTNVRLERGNGRGRSRDGKQNADRLHDDS